MPRYRIYYLKEHHREGFQQSPPQSQPVRLKPARYEGGPEIEAASPYTLWKDMEDGNTALPEGAPKLRVGDVLEDQSTACVIMRYWGFDEAAWETQDQVPQEVGDPALESPAETV